MLCRTVATYSVLVLERLYLDCIIHEKDRRNERGRRNDLCKILGLSSLMRIDRFDTSKLVPIPFKSQHPSAERNYSVS
jgi:hypothetical protein